MFDYQGVTTPMWSWTSTVDGASSLNRLKSTHSNSVIIDFHLSTESMTGSVVDYRNDKTIGQLKDAIKTAKEIGFDVWFKPIVIAGYGPDQNSWQNLNPKDVTSWFSTYKNKILEIAGILEETGASHFILTNELFSLTTDPKNIYNWLDVINSVRNVYSGKIGFNFGALLGPWDTGNEIGSVPQQILDASDFIGLSTYPRVQESSPFTLDSVKDGWFDSAYHQNLAKILSEFLASQDLPIYFTELGSPAYRDGNYGYGNNFTPDLESQKNFYSASLDLIHNYFPHEIEGVFIYNWLLSDQENFATNTGTYSPYDWNINGKPAAEAVSLQFSTPTPDHIVRIKALPFSEVVTGTNNLDIFDFGEELISGVDISLANNTIKVKVGQAEYLLAQVERLVFNDISIGYDKDGSAGEAYRLYKAAFDRTPDLGGLGYWIDALDHGVSLSAVASAFIASPEFADMYGANTTDTNFVTLLYNHVLHRDPDAEGNAYWLNALHNGMTRGAVLASFSESPENIAQTAPLIANGIQYQEWAL